MPGRALTVAWLAATTVFFRRWDMTIRVERLPLWTVLFAGLYAAHLVVEDRRGPSTITDAAEPDRPGGWSDVWLWVGLAASATLVTLLFPQIVIGAATVQSVALLRVVEVIVPLWIVSRGVTRPWRGGARALSAAGTLVYALFIVWLIAVRMPGTSYSGPLPPLDPAEQESAAALARHVTMFADSIGVRGFRRPERVREALAYLRAELEALGCRPVERAFTVQDQEHTNLEVTLPGGERADEIVVVGAHYDTHDLTPGADDNASGVAGVLELARMLRGARPERTLRLVFFATEEPPFFNTPQMGSRVYASQSADAGEDLVAMFSLETIGYFRDESGTQRYPPPFSLFYPDRGDFVAFVGNPASGRLVRRSLTTFRASTEFPSEGAAVSSMIPGVELSDHASFWRAGYRALMITDTAPFRNVAYHTGYDTVDTLDFERMARVVAGVRRVVEAEAGIDS